MQPLRTGPAGPEGRQTGPLYRRDMDENVLAATLRLNEPITFGRVEPLHDTGRHRMLSPFWNFDDIGALHRIQDVARLDNPYMRPSTGRAATQRKSEAGGCHEA